MREQGRSAGRLALRIVLVVVALLVLVNGIVLLCETDPARFYANLFGRPAISSTNNP
jgi:hypothetical protein